MATENQPLAAGCDVNQCGYDQLISDFDRDYSEASQEAPDHLQAVCGALRNVVRSELGIEIPCGNAAYMLLSLIPSSPQEQQKLLDKALDMVTSEAIGSTPVSIGGRDA